jgi:integrase
VRGRVESVLDWAAARGLRQGENPARWKGHLDKLLPRKSKVHKIEHHAALPHAEIAAFMADLRKLGSTTARALEFTILTATRTCEVLGAKWEEVDLKTATWTVPADRMKARREHRVPLSRSAIAVLQAMHAVRQAPPDIGGGRLLFFQSLFNCLPHIMHLFHLIRGFRVFSQKTSASMSLLLPVSSKNEGNLEVSSPFRARCSTLQYLRPA